MTNLKVQGASFQNFTLSNLSSGHRAPGRVPLLDSPLILVLGTDKKGASARSQLTKQTTKDLFFIYLFIYLFLHLL